MISFLQSPEWEEFQNSLGRNTWRSGGRLLVEHKTPGGFSYLYSPRPELTDDFIGDFVKEARRISRKCGAVFLRIDPFQSLNLPKRYFWKFARSVQPRKTVKIDLQNSVDSIRSAMHEKTRYNIGLAERKGVIVDLDSFSVLSIFYEMLRATARREKFHIHAREHYAKLLDTRSENFYNEIFFARYRRSIIASALVNFYKPSRTVTYLHGASSRDSREVMAPHLLHWKIIEEAKKRGFQYYDFWGIDEKRWPGLTRFKTGFGGETVEFPHTVDIVFRPFWYLVYSLVRKFK